MSATMLDERPDVLDEAVFNRLWQVEYPAIVRYMTRRVPSADAEDLAAVALEKAWNGRHTYRPGAGTLTAWLYRIAGNTVVDHYRTTGRRPHTVGGITLDQPDDLDVAEQVAEAIDGRAEAEHAQRVVRAALAQLPDRQRRVVELRLLAGQSIADTAATIGAPVGTVKSLAHRAMAALRALLVPAPPVPDPARVALAEMGAALPPDPNPAPESRSVCHALVTRPGAGQRLHCRPHRRRPPDAGVVLQPTLRGADRSADQPGGVAGGRRGLEGVAVRHRPGRSAVLRCGGPAAPTETRRHRLAGPRPGTPGVRRGDAASPQIRSDGGLTPMPNNPHDWAWLAVIVLCALATAGFVAHFVVGAVRDARVLRRDWPPLGHKLASEQRGLKVAQRALAAADEWAREEAYAHPAFGRPPAPGRHRSIPEPAVADTPRWVQTPCAFDTTPTGQHTWIEAQP